MENTKEQERLTIRKIEKLQKKIKEDKGMTTVWSIFSGAAATMTIVTIKTLFLYVDNLIGAEFLLAVSLIIGGLTGFSIKEAVMSLLERHTHEQELIRIENEDENKSK